MPAKIPERGNAEEAVKERFGSSVVVGLLMDSVSKVQFF